MGALTGLAPALISTSARASWELAGGAVSVVSRAGRAVGAAPAAAVREVTALVDREPARRVWSAEGRAQLEVWGLQDPEALVATSVQDALKALPGVSSARVDVVTRRAVVRFDPAQRTVPDLVAAVADAEQTVGVTGRDHVHAHPGHPADAGPVVAEACALAADLAGLTAAVAGWVTRLPSLPGSAAAAVVLVDNQPRLRGWVERRLGLPATDLVMAVSNAVAWGLTQGAPSLVVDSAQRAQGLLAARARRTAFTTREGELWTEERPARHEFLDRSPRPVPLPAGPVERYADRAAAGALLAAGGLLAATGSLDLAGRALLIGAPKAAVAARKAFADTLTAGLSRRGLVVLDPAALPRLDRVDTVVVDSAVLHDDRPLVVSARATADRWTAEHVWSTSQRLLWAGVDLPVPPPGGRRRPQLTLVRSPGQVDHGLARHLLLQDGTPVGDVVVGSELDPYADAVLGTGQSGAVRLVLTADAAAPELSGRADEVLDGADRLLDEVLHLQADGRVVALISTHEEALAAADVGIGIVPRQGRVPWAADLLCGGLVDVPRLLAAIPAARAVSSHGVTTATAATFLGSLLTAVAGPGHGSRGVLPVTAAAAAAQVFGTVAARRVCRQPGPEPVHHTPWHALEIDEVLARLPSPAPGAGTPQDTVRTARFGPAVGSVVAPLTALARNVAAELADPLTPVLATGALASAVIGSPTDALLVGGVLAANALISGAQRLRADQALRTLLSDEQLLARVVVPAPGLAPFWDGAARPRRRVPAASLRPGHVIDLRPGDVVPADARLLQQDLLEVDEAGLTGESVAIPKQTEATPGAELADRACLVYEGTTVLTGTGRAVVVAVGAATEAGRALALAGRAGAPAGMQARLEELTRRGLPVTLLGGAAVTGLALLRGRQRLPRAIASGISVAVAAVPEGLPLVATVAQLSAARRLSARGVLVRSGRTVEALGRVDTVCFDKTGTLTEGRLRLARLAALDEQWPPDSAQGRRILLAAAHACPRSDGEQPVAHATDQAILDAADLILGEQVDQDWEELSELPFQSERGFSAALGRTADQMRLVVKGAPEVLLPRCTHERDDSGKRPLDRAGRDRATRMVHDLAARGLRVLAVARRNVSAALADASPRSADAGPEELTEDLTLLGFVGLADIPRPEAAPTIATLEDAGLSTVMITGDHPVTAHAIAAGLGIPTDRVVTGPELAGLDDAARTALVSQASVFARISPEQKLRIIAAVQHAGRVVAMTGDGANDAAAIRLADVGVGMAAHGSTSARTAADLVLTTPDVSLLLDALVEGRAMWGRVRDAVAILLGGNAGEVGFTLAGTALAGRAPLGTRQFLLVNMLTDLLPSMAIALAPTPNEPAERHDLLTGGVPSLGAPLIRDIAVRGVATGAGALLAWQIGRVTGTRRRASTMALAALVGTQLGQTLLVGGRNPVVLATGIGSTALLAAIVQTPGVSHFFGCTPIGPFAWLTVAGCATGTTVLAAVTDRLLPAAEQYRLAPEGAAPTARPAETSRPLPVSDRRPTPELHTTETR